MAKSNKILLGILVILALSFVGFRWYELYAGPVAVQPVQFSHKVHAEAAKCNDCHTTVETAASAGLPDISVCMGCHEGGPVTKSPEEKKLIGFAKDKKDLDWEILNKLPVHVYFNHARHVKVGKLACDKCHGGMGKIARPPARALVKVNMNFCLACHRKNNIDTSCVICHR